MDFNQVRYFLALADTLNFTRAAEKCYVSQPALTQAIKRLESELGGELIGRDGKHTELTEMGKSLRRHFEQIDEIRHLVRTTAKAITSGEIAELNIGVMCTIGPRVIAKMLDDFHMQHPKVSLVLHDVTPDSIRDIVLSGAVDGVFCARHKFSDRQSSLRYIELFEEPMIVAFPNGHEFLDKESIPLRDISKQRYIDRLHCEFRKEHLEFCEEQGLELDVAFRSQREDWIQSLVRDGMGVSIIPQYSLLRPELDYRSITAPVLMRKVEFTVADSIKVNPTLDRFIGHVKNHNWPISQ